MPETRERSALEVLRQVEWVQDEYGGWCPICGMEEDQGHAPDCALDAVLRATPAADSYWWCPECREDVDASRVTYQELHDTCGTRVETRATPASDGTTRWYCEYGCGCVLDSRAARYHDCRRPASDGGEVRERVGAVLRRWNRLAGDVEGSEGPLTETEIAAISRDVAAALRWHTEREADRRWGERGETRDEGGEE